MSESDRILSAHYPRSTTAQKAWLARRWPWIDVDLERVHPDAFAFCLPVLEKLAAVWPQPFAALKRLKATPESAGWPDTSARAWYDGEGGIHFRQVRWSSPADAKRCEYTLPHEFGHHLAHWLLAKDETREEVAAFMRGNFRLGTMISDYAALSPSEAWAEGFEELHNRAEADWHLYTQRQAELLAPWRMKQRT